MSTENYLLFVVVAMFLLVIISLGRIFSLRDQLDVMRKRYEAATAHRTVGIPRELGAGYGDLARDYPDGYCGARKIIFSDKASGFPVKGDSAVPARIGKELSKLNDKWREQDPSGAKLTPMELAVRALRRANRLLCRLKGDLKATRAELRKITDAHVALKQTHALMLKANEGLAGVNVKPMPLRLPALNTTWQCEKLPPFDEPARAAMAGRVGSRWRVHALAENPDMSFTVTIIGTEDSNNTMLLHVPLKMFREHFSRPA